MKKTWFFTFIFLFTSSISRCELIIPQYHEVTYGYYMHVNLSSGSNEIHGPYSVFAQMTLRAYQNYISVTVSKPDENDPKKELTSTSWGGEMETALKSFVIEYDIDGHAIALHTDREDNVLSINMKKAIASILQLDTSKIDFKTNKTQHILVDEQSIYGNCPVIQNVNNYNSNNFIVTKTLTPSKCVGYVQEHDFNIVFDQCDKPFVNPINSFVERKYDIEILDNAFLIKSIDVKNIISATPNTGHFSVFDISHGFIYERSQRSSRSTPINVTSLKQHKLKISPVEKYEDRELFDFKVVQSGGKIKKLDEIKQDIRNGLQKVLLHLSHEDKTFDNTQYGYNNDSFYKLIELSRSLNATDLAEVYEQLKLEANDDDLASLFLQISSLTGTRDWVLFICDKIKYKKISEYEAKTLLEQLPFNVKYPDVNIIKDMLALLDDESIEPKLENTIILSISSVVSKVLQLRPNDQETPLIVKRFIDSFKSASSQDQQLIYMNALVNIRSPKVIKFLETIITSTTDLYSSRIITMAIFALKDNSDEQYVNRLLWPIFEDKSNSLELRFAAMNVLVSTRSMENLLKLHFAMSSESNDQLYNAFYKYLGSVASSSVPCYTSFNERAKSIMKMFRGYKQQQSSAFEYLYEYFNEKFNFGAVFKTSMIGNIFTDQITEFFVDTAPQILGLSLSQESVYIRVTLKNYTLAEEIYRSSRPRQYFTHLIQSISDNLIKVDVTRIRNHKILSFDRDVISKYYDRTFEESEDDVFSHPVLGKYYSVSQKVSGETNIPNELGLPVSYFVRMPALQRTSYRAKVDEIMKIFHKSNQFNHQIHGLKMYHPILNAWIGARWNHIVKLDIPINFTLGNPRTTLQFTMQNDKDDTFNFKSFVFFDTFITSIEADAACRDCNRSSLSYRPDESYENILWEYKFPFSDATVRIKGRDPYCDEIISTNLKNIIINNENMNMASALLALRNSWAYATLMPDATIHERCGIEVRIDPGFETSITDLKSPSLAPCDPSRACTVWILVINQSFVGGTGDGPKSWRLITELSDLHMTETNATISFKSAHWGARLRANTIRDGDTLNTTYIFSSGTSERGIYPWDESETSIEVHGIGQLSPEQRDPRVLEKAYETCKMSNTPTLKCLDMFVTPRTYKFDVKYSNVSKSWWRLASIFTKMSAEYVESFALEKHSDMEENTFRLEMKYPLLSDYLFDVNVTTRFTDVVFERVPINKLYPAHLLLPRVKRDIYVNLGSIDHFFERCYIDLDHITPVDSKRRKFDLNQEWTLLVEVGDSHKKRRVFANKSGERIGLNYQEVLMDSNETAGDSVTANEVIKNNFLVYKIGGDKFLMMNNNAKFHYEESVYVRGDVIDYKKIDGRLILGTGDGILWVTFDGKTIDLTFGNEKTNLGECIRPFNVLTNLL